MAQTPEPDPRRKRAFLIGGALAVAAIAWNSGGIWDNHDHRERGVQITIGEDEKEETRETERVSVRESDGDNREDADFSERMDRFGERMGEAGDRIGERFGEVGDRIGSRFDEAGERIEEIAEEAEATGNRDQAEEEIGEIVRETISGSIDDLTE